MDAAQSTVSDNRLDVSYLETNGMVVDILAYRGVQRECSLSRAVEYNLRV